MMLRSGDFIELEGVSEEGLKQVRDAFVSAGFEEGEPLNERNGYKYYGVDAFIKGLWFYNATGAYSDTPRLLTIDQVLSTNIEFEEAHQRVEQATPEVSEEVAIEKQARYTNDDGKDLIDKWAERYTQEEFRLIMLAMIEKYMTRMGRKDSIAQECRKIADYANRLVLVEEGRG